MTAAKHARPEAPPAAAAPAEVRLPDGLAPLTLADICDHGDDGEVTAQVAVAGQEGKLLMFCKHHFEAAEKALARQGFKVLQDNRHLLA